MVKSGKTTSGEIQLTDALAAMVEEGVKFVPFEVQEWFDCGKLETLLDTNRYFLTKLTDPDPIDGVQIIPPVHIGAGVRIEQSVIGPFVSIQDNASVRRSIMENCIVGVGAKIENVHAVDSFFGERTSVEGEKKTWSVADSSDS